MADALASGASVLRDVGVQVPLRPQSTALRPSETAVCSRHRRRKRGDDGHSIPTLADTPRDGMRSAVRRRADRDRRARGGVCQRSVQRPIHRPVQRGRWRLSQRQRRSVHPGPAHGHMYGVLAEHAAAGRDPRPVVGSVVDKVRRGGDRLIALRPRREARPALRRLRRHRRAVAPRPGTGRPSPAQGTSRATTCPGAGRCRRRLPRRQGLRSPE